MQYLPLTCDEVERSSLAGRFLARTLPLDDAERFESHFLTCERCQHALTLGATTRAALRESSHVATTAASAAVASVHMARASPSHRWWIPMSAAAAALIAVLGYRAGNASTRSLQPLGAVTQAPVYLGVPVRAGNDERGIAVFDSAMTEYAAQRWQSSAQLLRAAIAAGKSDSPSHFFLGAALLMRADARDAIAAFSEVISAGSTPYTSEALLYRAKAHLQLREGAEAAADLARLIDRDVTADDVPSGVSAHARALRDSIRVVGVR